MWRVILLSFILTSAVLLAERPPARKASAKPRPAPQARRAARLAEYLPMDKGNYWSYAAPQVRDASWVTLRVLEKKPTGDADCYQIETSADSIAGPRKELGSICLSETKDGLVLSLDRLTRYEPPLPILKLPALAGGQWRWEGRERRASAGGQREGSRALYEFAIDKEEELQVPAGRFQALKLSVKKYFLDTNSPAPPREPASAVSYWFARKVGIIKTTDFGPLFGIHGELKEFHVAGTRSNK